MINPIEHSRTKDAANKYKIEPYVIAADIYGQSNLAGRGGWSWYTGSSSWMYIAGIKYILGLNIEKGELRIEPHIPKSWNEYSIRYKYGNSIYNIKVVNNNNAIDEINLKCNGERIKGNKIKLNEDGGIYNIEAQI